MRVVLPFPEAPAPTWREWLPHLTWRWSGPLCVLFVLTWLLGQTGVSEISPDSKHPPLRLAHPKPASTDWPGWRGTTQQGLADDPAAPVQWSQSTNVVWQTDLPGVGQSSPCVSGGAVYLTARVTETRSVALLKFDRETGRLAWHTELCRGSTDHADPTPTTDGQMVYVPVVDDGQVWLCAVTAGGALQWKRAAGPYAGTRPYRSSPVVSGSLVYVAADHRGSRWDGWRSTSTLTAFHRQTGEIVWRALRPNGDSAGIPVVAEIAGRRQLVLAGRGAVTSYDPETGAELWICRWTADHVTGSIAYDDEHVYACGRQPDAEMLCIRAEGAGDVTDTHIVWRERRTATDGPSPVVVGPAMLLLGDQGQLTALDKATGRQLWQKKLTGQYEASPVAIKNRLYCTNREGTTFVVDIDRRGEVLAESPLGQPVAGSLAVSGQRLIIRGEQRLLMIAPSQRDIYAAEPAPSPRKL